MNVPNHERKAFKDMTPEERGAIVEALVGGIAECFYDNKWTPCYGIIELRYSYRTRPRQLVIPWDVIKPQYKWAAMESDGNVYFYKKKPEPMLEHWSGGIVGSASAINIDTTGIDWRESLVQRPE